MPGCADRMLKAGTVVDELVCRADRIWCGWPRRPNVPSLPLLPDRLDDPAGCILKDWPGSFRSNICDGRKFRRASREREKPELEVQLDRRLATGHMPTNWVG